MAGYSEKPFAKREIAIPGLSLFFNCFIRIQFTFITQTPTVSNQADAEQNAYSIEITQEVLQETPIIADDSSSQALPVEYHIYNILGHHQYFAIGCEASAAMDWADFFGITINEFNFQY